MKPSTLLIPIVVMLLVVSVFEWMAYRLIKRRWDHKRWWSMFGKLWLVIAVLLSPEKTNLLFSSLYISQTFD